MSTLTLPSTSIRAIQSAVAAGAPSWASLPNDDALMGTVATRDVRNRDGNRSAFLAFQAGEEDDVDYEIYHEASRAYGDAHPEQRRCFALDRATFEREGRAYAPGMRETFYATEEAAAPQTLFLQ